MTDFFLLEHFQLLSQSRNLNLRLQHVWLYTLAYRIARSCYLFESVQQITILGRDLDGLRDGVPVVIDGLQLRGLIKDNRPIVLPLAIGLALCFLASQPELTWKWNLLRHTDCAVSKLVNKARERLPYSKVDERKLWFRQSTGLRRPFGCGLKSKLRRQNIRVIRYQLTQ